MMFNRIRKWLFPELTKEEKEAKENLRTVWNLVPMMMFLMALAWPIIFINSLIKGDEA